MSEWAVGDENPWHWLVFDASDDGRTAKSHAVPSALVNVVVSDLLSRGHRLKSRRPLDSVHMDWGGSVLLTEPVIALHASGLSVEFQVSDARRMLSETIRAPPRVAGGGKTYYKVHGAFRCLVLTEKDHSALLATLKTIEPGAVEMSEAFWGST